MSLCFVFYDTLKIDGVNNLKSNRKKEKIVMDVKFIQQNNQVSQVY